MHGPITVETRNGGICSIRAAHNQIDLTASELEELIATLEWALPLAQHNEVIRFPPIAG